MPSEGGFESSRPAAGGGTAVIAGIDLEVPDEMKN